MWHTTHYEGTGKIEINQAKRHWNVNALKKGFHVLTMNCIQNWHRPFLIHYMDECMYKPLVKLCPRYCILLHVVHTGVLTNSIICVQCDFPVWLTNWPFLISVVSSNRKLVTIAQKHWMRFGRIEKTYIIHFNVFSIEARKNAAAAYSCHITLG